MAETKKQQSRTSRRSSGLIVTDPKAVAWVWKRGVKVGQGRKPDHYLYEETDIAEFDTNDWHIVKAAGPWVSGGSTTTAASKRK